jgi:hypothetical protein
VISPDTAPGGHWPPVPIKARTQPIIPDSCARHTYYYFNPDGSFTSVDCQGVHTELGSWQVKYDTNSKASFVFIMAANNTIATPITDTIQAESGRYLYDLSIVIAGELTFYGVGLEFWGNNLNDSLDVGWANSTIINHIFLARGTMPYWVRPRTKAA